jgi:S1-C subfamily serine protease
MDTNRTPRPWTSAVAGALTGGLLAASIAVPGTWALTREEDATSPTSTATVPTPPTEPSTRPETSSSEVTDAESQGVVLVETTLTGGSAAGTGLVIDASGLVLTNYHVVEGSTSVEVTVATDGTSYDAEVVGFDRASDIAVLRLDGASDLATVDLDDDGDPAVADEVTAVGNAAGQGHLSASSGTVVALDRSITTGTEGAALGEHLTGLIQTDAYVVGGYSGGALLDDEDEVVGVTTAASSGGRAESYAIPIDDALAVADRIESGDESDGVQVGPSPYLGVAVAETGTGLRVAEVEDGGAAAKAGIAAGDVLTGVGSRTVDSLDELKDALATYQPGERATLRWTRHGRAHDATVALGSSPVA